MSIKQINEKIITMGLGLLYKIKYASATRYSAYDFMVTRYKKREHLKHKLSHSIYKKKI
jgi:hypothetical protein